MIRHLLFDLDGTLIDSRGTISAALGFALRQAGITLPGDDVIRSFIGRPLLDIFTGDFGMDGAQAQQAIECYRARYQELGRRGSRVYDQVPESLASLGRAGFQLYVATVKPEAIATRVLAEFGLRGHFRGIAGSSPDSARRHKADIIGHALETHMLAPELSLMIGDRAEDVNGARAHGLDTIGVAYGYGGREELAAAGARHVASAFDEVCQLVLGETRP